MDEPSLFIPLGRSGMKRRTLSALAEENTALHAFVFIIAYSMLEIIIKPAYLFVCEGRSAAECALVTLMGL